MRRIELQHIVTSSGGRHRSPTEVLQAALVGPTVSVDSAVSPLSQGANGAASGVTDQVAQLTSQLSQLRAAQATSISSLLDNTQALVQNTVTKASGGGSTLGTIGSVASSFLTSGFGLSPIISGLVSLFGGNSRQTVTPLVPFTLPPSVNYQGGVSGANPGQVSPVDYGQDGRARNVNQAPAPQVNIQVNAMDSKSFLDHSNDIAMAVRQAILNSSSLNDVIADL